MNRVSLVSYDVFCLVSPASSRQSECRYFRQEAVTKKIMYVILKNAVGIDHIWGKKIQKVPFKTPP
jgi:hypothetical protein